MPQIHNQLHRGILTDALKRFLGLTKDPGGIERYSESLTVGLDLWSGDLPELAYLRGETLWVSLLSSAAVVGEFSTVAYSVPAEAKLILTVDAIRARGTSSIFIQMPLRSTIAATLAAAAAPFVRDNRTGSQLLAAPTSAVEAWTGSDAATLNNNMDEILAAAAYQDFLSPPYIVRPTTGLVVQGNTANASIQVVAVGRVRAANPGELV